MKLAVGDLIAVLPSAQGDASSVRRDESIAIPVRPALEAGDPCILARAADGLMPVRVASLTPSHPSYMPMFRTRADDQQTLTLTCWNTFTDDFTGDTPSQMYSLLDDDPDFTASFRHGHLVPLQATHYPAIYRPMCRPNKSLSAVIDYVKPGGDVLDLCVAYGGGLLSSVSARLWLLTTNAITPGLPVYPEAPLYPLRSEVTFDAQLDIGDDTLSIEGVTLPVTATATIDQVNQAAGDQTDITMTLAITFGEATHTLTSEFEAAKWSVSHYGSLYRPAVLADSSAYRLGQWDVSAGDWDPGGGAGEGDGYWYPGGWSDADEWIEPHWEGTEWPDAWWAGAYYPYGSVDVPEQVRGAVTVPAHTLQLHRLSGTTQTMASTVLSEPMHIDRLDLAILPRE